MPKSKQSSSLISPNKLVAKLANTHAGLVFVRRFQNSLARTKVLPRGSRVVVAVSGGPDSMTLVTLLARLQKKHAYELHLAHVNYELRGQDSDRDEALVRKVAHSYALPITVFHPKVKPTSNIEEKLRLVRYRHFEQLRKRLGFDVIVTAHTMNDVAETVLMNLIRGAGAAGLSPFKEKNAQRLARPLLSFNRKDIEAFLLGEVIPSRTDRSNHSKRFTRNRIRREVIPLLETFNPSIIQTLATTNTRIAVSRSTPQYPLVTERFVSHQPVHSFSRSAFCELPVQNQEQFLHDVFRAFSPDGKSPSHRFITECTRVINSPRPGPKTLRSGRLKCQCFHDRIETTLN